MGEYDEAVVQGWWERQTPLGLLAKVVGALILLSIVFGIIGYAGGWIGEGKRVISPANVREQWQFAYDYDRSLDAIAKQWCTADQAEQAETDPAIKSMRTNQRIGIENNYQRVKAEYDARLADAFRARIVRPRDVPREAPSLEDNVAENCPR